VLQNQMNDISSLQSGAVDLGAENLISETIKYAVIVVAAAPILCVYPFIQKYFVKGVMVGSIKG
jgi:putative aldouronate transport system permease protein